MTPLDKCPRCGERVVAKDQTWVDYACHSGFLASGQFNEGMRCASNQRDQLAARVKELEDARTKAAANSLATMLAYEDAMRRIYELESESDVVMGKAMAWKAYAGRLEEAGNPLAEIVGPPDQPMWAEIPDCDRAYIGWTKTKETKP